MAHYDEQREADTDDKNGVLLDLALTKKTHSNPFNWTGSKHRYLKDLFSVLPCQEGIKVLDPFVGGGDLISKLPLSWIITASDSMEQIIGLHKAVQSGLINSKGTLEKYNERGMSKLNKDAYLSLRSEYNASKDPELLYLLMTNSFNNQLRFNLSGGFNMPFGKDRSTFNKNMICKLDNYAEALKQREVKFICGEYSWWDFLSFDLILIDPPYLNTTATYNESTGWNEENDLCLFDALDEVNAYKKNFVYFNQLIANGKRNDQLSVWSKKYNVRVLKETTKNCSYNKKGGETIEIMVWN